MIIFHPTFGAGKVINLEGLGVQKKAKWSSVKGEAGLFC